MIRRIWRDIKQGENLDLYLTVFVALVVGFVSLFGFANQAIVASLTLAVLALLAYSILKSRYQFEDISNKLETSNGELISRDFIFSQDRPVLTERIRRAKSVAHNGISLIGTTNDPNLSEFANNGGEIRLLLIDPKDIALEVASQRFYKHQNPIELKDEVELSLKNLRNMQATGPKLVSIRLFRAVPAYSIWLIDANTSQAEMWVGLYTFRDRAELWLHLLPHRDKQLFDFFSKQFEKMWDSSYKWPLQNAGHPDVAE